MRTGAFDAVRTEDTAIRVISEIGDRSWRGGDLRPSAVTWERLLRGWIVCIPHRGSPSSLVRCTTRPPPAAIFLHITISPTYRCVAPWQMCLMDISRCAMSSATGRNHSVYLCAIPSAPSRSPVFLGPPVFCARAHYEIMNGTTRGGGEDGATEGTWTLGVYVGSVMVSGTHGSRRSASLASGGECANFSTVVPNPLGSVSRVTAAHMCCPHDGRSSAIADISRAVA
jgi:hypothetical protein